MCVCVSSIHFPTTPKYNVVRSVVSITKVFTFPDFSFVTIIPNVHCCVDLTRNKIPENRFLSRPFYNSTQIDFPISHLPHHKTIFLYSPFYFIFPHTLFSQFNELTEYGHFFSLLLHYK